MLHLRFNPTPAIRQLLAELSLAREALDAGLSPPDPFLPELRRHVIAASVHYSTRIEGNTLTLEQVETLLRGGQVSAPPSQAQEARNYYEAMQYAQSVVAAPSPCISEDTIKALHYIVAKLLPGDYNPGRYREGRNFVVDRTTGRALFRPPPPDQVETLMDEYVRWLNTRQAGMDPYCKAALAHLNFVAIHPFYDGNGRTARLIETMALYLAGYKSPSLVSSEEYFGKNATDYYHAIANALGDAYDPESCDVTSWVEFYLRAYQTQAADAVRRRRWLRSAANALVVEFYPDITKDLPWRRRPQGEVLLLNKEAADPMGIRLTALFAACYWGAVTNKYLRDAASGVSSIGAVGNQAAAKHLARLAEVGLLVRDGRGRSTRYLPADKVLRVFKSAIAKAQAEDESPLSGPGG